ncbi:TPA: hypothetical protein R4057_002005 [Kluyvera ascorbata]|uniref:hypothetical protein n=1 Tax=Kluyvera ascorbata TaxID=51288 RepID=UPI0028A1F1C8|nr:hypothetical protein [Kluyvera ascorbata]HED3065052.1 hypothetical protein [Kluyvera ascorbata]
MKSKICTISMSDVNYLATSYSNDVDFVTIYSKCGEFYSPLFQPGNVLYSTVSGELSDYINENHPGSTVINSVTDVGVIKKKVWRPGLNVDVGKALDVTQGEFNKSKRELRILIEKLKDILLYVEPCESSMDIYGHKLRELLILTCTAVESYWLSYLKDAAPSIERPTTRDYVKLKDILLLGIYKIKFVSHPFILEFSPFDLWSQDAPTRTLPWYDAYNQTKHDSVTNFNKADLRSCIQAIGALIIMQCVRFGPYDVLEGQELTAQLINEHFVIEVGNPSVADFYVPSFQRFEMATGAFSAPLASRMNPWVVEPWSLE